MTGTLTVNTTGGYMRFSGAEANIGLASDIDMINLSSAGVYINTDLTVTGSLSADHGTLFGLTDDDHSIYLNTTRHDTTDRHGASVVDHGLIGGLTDDDHPQYVLVDGSRDMFSLTVTGDITATTATFSGLINAQASIDLVNGQTLQWDTDNYIYGNTASRISILTGGSETVRWNLAGAQLINDDENTKMTVGLTINQGDNDDEILALKSSEIAHGELSTAETDTYALFKKVSATLGGLRTVCLAHDDVIGTVYSVFAYGGTATSTKSTAGRALMEMYATEHDGNNNITPITDNGNIFGIRCRLAAGDRTRWILDEDGDTWQAGSITLGSTTVTEAQLIALLALL
jgi:hypothetical protein